MLNSINDLIDSNLTSLPIVYFKLEKALNDENIETDEIARIVQGDPGISTRILKMANSPLWGLSQHIETIPHALTIIGREELKLLALSTVLRSSFNNVPKSLIDLNSFWRNSIACGVIAREVCSLNNFPNLERYFMAGMLHNIGSLVIFNKVPKIAQNILLQCEKQKKKLFILENQYLGYNHCDLGGGLLDAWGIPKPLVEAALYHHTPNESEEFPHLVWTIYSANILAMELNFGSNGDILTEPLDDCHLNQIGITLEDWENLKMNAPEIIEDFLNYFE